MPKENLSGKIQIKKHFLNKFNPSISKIAIPIFFIILISILFYYFYHKKEIELSASQIASQKQYNLQKLSFENKISQIQSDFDALKNTDQVKRNDTLQSEINSIVKEYTTSIGIYEDILKLQDAGVKTQPLTSSYTKAILYLSQKNYSSASAELTSLANLISQEQVKLQTPTESIPANVPQVKEAPTSGYRKQSVDSDVGTFLVDVIAADLNTARVVVETASDGNCSNNCPVTSLADYVARAGGFAGINGPYFCPAEYPSCAGKTNSFDTLLMNRKKTYFNSDNNVYSTVPAVIFSGNSARYVGQSLEWGRDTGVDSVIANQPLLVSGGNVSFNGDGDPKRGSKGPRNFIGTTGSTVYIGSIRNATTAEAAHVIKSMGIQNALNLDSGGSTALYLNGSYLAGPGRNTPFGIVFVRK